MKCKAYSNEDYDALCGFIRDNDYVFPLLVDRQKSIEGYVRERLRNDARIVIGYEGKRIIGTFIYEFKNSDVIQLMYALLKPNMRKSRLLFDMINHATKYEPDISQIRTIRAQTWTANERVIDLLEKYGFSVLEEKPRHMHPDRTSLIFERDFRSLVSVLTFYQKVYRTIDDFLHIFPVIMLSLKSSINPKWC
ncbi:MAG: hypothetical protein ABIA93_05065 [Candidatus Woesearchaeota archaeon]